MSSKRDIFFFNHFYLEFEINDRGDDYESNRTIVKHIYSIDTGK